MQSSNNLQNKSKAQDIQNAKSKQNTQKKKKESCPVH